MRQVGGSHYKTGSIEHWDLVSRYDVGYLEGNATKYVCRSRNKNGRQDLEKAEHYMDKLIELVRDGEMTIPPRGYASDEAVREFSGFQNLTSDEASFVRMLCQWQTLMELHVARQLLKQIIASYPVGTTFPQYEGLNHHQGCKVAPVTAKTHPRVWSHDSLGDPMLDDGPDYSKAEENGE